MIQKDHKRLLVRASGKVQGVGFRWFVVGEAERLGLRGWVRNAPDGSVEVEMEGPVEAVNALLARLAVGPPAARVTSVQRLAAGTLPLPDAFEIVR